MQRKQVLSLQIKTPSSHWDLKFIRVYENKNNIIAIAKLIEPGPIAVCAHIEKIDAKIEINQAGINAKPVQYFVKADRDGWWLKSDKFTAIHHLESIKDLTDDMQEIYSLDENSLVSKSKIIAK